MEDSEPWYADSGCSELSLSGLFKNFISFHKPDSGSITFGDKGKGIIEGKGKVSFSNSLQVDDVNLVETWVSTC